jgi:hypothetical protein
MGFNLFRFIGNAARTAGKPIGSAFHAIDKASGAIGGAISGVATVGNAIDPGSMNDLQELGNTMQQAGATIARADETVQAAQALLPPEARPGFLMGVGLMKRAVTPPQIQALRNSMPGPPQQGFDHALALHIARVTRPRPPVLTDKQAAGYFTTMGVVGSDPNQKAAVVGTVVQDPEAKTGAQQAIAETKQAKEGWWHRLLRWLHLAS